jgi:hypothetical protein
MFLLFYIFVSRYAGVKPNERGKTYMVSSKKASLEKKRTAKGKTKGAVRMVDSRLKKDKRHAPKSAKLGPKRKRG